MYLLIENKGVCPIEGFTTLGVSTARGKTDKLGQFGSGASNAILVLLRHNLNPIIYLGEKKAEFYTEPGEMSGINYNRVCCRFNGNTEKTSMTLGWGEKDWNNLGMAARELISNGLDGCSNTKEITIKVVSDEEIEPKEEFTRVYVPLAPDIQKYYNELNNHFLHFNQEEKIKENLLFKNGPGPARIFRKGVFVREIDKVPSLYNYNFGDELKIDESRNLDDWNAKYQIANFWKSAKINHLEYLLGNFRNGDDVLEGKLHVDYMHPTSETEKENWKSAFKNCYGDAVISHTAHGNVSVAAAKRTQVVVTKSSTLYDCLRIAGVRTAIEVVHGGKSDSKGRVSHMASATLISRCQKVWEKIEQVNLTNGQRFPEIRVFDQIMHCGSEKMGFYKDGAIHIHKDHQTNNQVILEELCHHISGASDETRDFQDYVLKLATATMFRKGRQSSQV